MPAWIKARAERILPETRNTYGPDKAKQVAFALATQQAHATGKAPKKWHGEPFGTPEGKREAKEKYDEPSKMQKTANTPHVKMPDGSYMEVGADVAKSFPAGSLFQQNEKGEWEAYETPAPEQAAPQPAAAAAKTGAADYMPRWTLEEKYDEPSKMQKSAFWPFGKKPGMPKEDVAKGHAEYELAAERAEHALKHRLHDKPTGDAIYPIALPGPLDWSPHVKKQQYLNAQDFRELARSQGWSYSDADHFISKYKVGDDERFDPGPMHAAHRPKTAAALYDEPSKMQKSAGPRDAREELRLRELEAIRALYGVRGGDIASRMARDVLGSGLTSAALSGVGTHSLEGAGAGLAAGAALGGLYGLGEGIYDRIKTERALRRGEFPDFSPSLAREALLPALAVGGTTGLVTQGITENSDTAVRNALLGGGIIGLAGLLRYAMKQKQLHDRERALARAMASGYRGSLEDQILPGILEPSRRDFEKAAGIFTALLEKARGKKERRPNVLGLQPSEGQMGLGPPVSSGTGITQMGALRPKTAQAVMTPQGPMIVGTEAPTPAIPPDLVPLPPLSDLPGPILAALGANGQPGPMLAARGAAAAPVLVPASMSAETTPLTPPANPPVPPPLPVASPTPGVTTTPEVAGPPRQPPSPRAPRLPPPVTQSAAGQAQARTQDAAPPKTPPAQPKPLPPPDKTTLAPKATVQESGGGSSKTGGLRAPRPWEEKRADEEEKEQGQIPPLEGLEREVAQFLSENQDPTDEQLREWAESKGYNVPAVEEAIYRLATKFALFSDDGRAKEQGKEPGDMSPEQLAMGIEVEKEHTPDEDTARRIALDHLAEMPDYYTRLKAMEAKEAQAKTAGESALAYLRGALGKSSRRATKDRIREVLSRLAKGKPSRVNLSPDGANRWNGTRDVGSPLRYAGPESVVEGTSTVPIGETSSGMETTAGLVSVVPHFLGALDSIIKAGS